MIYIIDIDGTICTTPSIEGVNRYDLSVPFGDRIQVINKLHDDGHTIIYWTARGSLSGQDWSELTQKQLKQWGCKYHEVRLGKPSYDVWVDDKAFNDQQFFHKCRLQHGLQKTK